MKKEIYGKAESDFTKEERKMFSIDVAIVMMIQMLQNDPMMAFVEMLHNGGQSPDTKALIGRTIDIGVKVLGMEVPTTQEEYNTVEKAVEDSPYGFEKFMKVVGDDYDAFLNEHQDIVAIVKTGKSFEEAEIEISEGDKGEEPQG